MDGGRPLKRRLPLQARPRGNAGQVQRRRIILASAAALLAPIASYGQQPKAVRRIGVLFPDTSDKPRSQGFQRLFRADLSQLGYEEGKNLAIEWRFGTVVDLPRLAQELVDQRVELIAAIGNETIEPARRAARTIPIVMMWATHPGMTLQYFPVTRPEDIGPALDRISANRPDALFVSAEAVQQAQGTRFAAFAIEQKLMPVELPLTYQVVLSAKTARAIELGFPLPSFCAPTG